MWLVGDLDEMVKLFVSFTSTFFNKQSKQPFNIRHSLPQEKKGSPPHISLHITISPLHKCKKSVKRDRENLFKQILQPTLSFSKLFTCGDAVEPLHFLWKPQTQSIKNHHLFTTPHRYVKQVNRRMNPSATEKCYNLSHHTTINLPLQRCLLIS